MTTPCSLSDVELDLTAGPFLRRLREVDPTEYEAVMEVRRRRLAGHDPEVERAHIAVAAMYRRPPDEPAQVMPPQDTPAPAEPCPDCVRLAEAIEARLAALESHVGPREGRHG